MNIKKTMIFKQEHLDIINGLARINRMEIKDVLFQLLENAFINLDKETKEEAEKLGKYIRESKKNIYFKNRKRENDTK